MSPDAVRATYRRMMNDRGETVVLRRYTGTGPNRSKFEASVMAVVQNYTAEELAGGVIQANKKAIILVEDLIDAQWSFATGTNRLIVETDVLVVRGKDHIIFAADDSSRRVATVLVAIELQIKG